MIKKLVDGWNSLDSTQKSIILLAVSVHGLNYIVTSHSKEIRSLKRRVKELEAK